MARRLSGFCAAPANSSHCSGGSGRPDAGTGDTPTILRTRCGAAATVRWMTEPPIEWPISENRSQPSRSASASTSAAPSAVVYEPSAPLASPYPRRSTTAYWNEPASRSGSTGSYAERSASQPCTAITLCGPSPCRV